MDVAQMLLQALITGVFTGSLLALTALGLNIIWGILGMINLAQVAFTVLAAYLCYWLYKLLGFSPFISTFLAFAIFFIGGAAMFNKFLGRILIGKPMSSTLLFFFGVYCILYGVAVTVFGTYWRIAAIPLTFASVKIVGVDFSLAQVVISFISIGIFLSIHCFFTRTRIGKAIRATAQSTIAAELMGIDSNKMYSIAFGLGLGIAGFAGGLMSIISAFNPEVMLAKLPQLFAACVLAGHGNLIGTFISGLIIGIASNVMAAFAPAIGGITDPLILIIILIVKPGGLFAKE